MDASFGRSCRRSVQIGGDVKVDNFTRTLLAIIAAALCAIALHPFFTTAASAAQVSGAKPGDLWVESTRSQRGGILILDLRNGNEWDCDSDCRLAGHVPLEQIK
jgi:hypothetical protein